MAEEQAAKICEASRISEFRARAASGICQEVAMDGNPFLTERVLWHGYDVFKLMRSRDFVDVIFLMLKGELPSCNQKRLFENMLVVLANPGPRHPATRAAMNAGVSKTNPVHILPIALSIMGGEHLGSLEVIAAMKFLERNRLKDPQEVVAEILEDRPEEAVKAHALAGFDRRFGERDPFAEALVTYLIDEHQICESLSWGQDFVMHLGDESIGWLMTGVAAAVFLDLGFEPNVGGGILQFAACPGLLAHGIEQSTKPITAMPFLPEENYIYRGKPDV
jgi:citrate synthase